MAIPRELRGSCFLKFEYFFLRNTVSSIITVVNSRTSQGVFNNKTNADKIEMAFQLYAYNFLSEGKS